MRETRMVQTRFEIQADERMHIPTPDDMPTPDADPDPPTPPDGDPMPPNGTPQPIGDPPNRTPPERVL
ncbi:hypothetical protein [Caballeronia hypogeia]|nr:hypothetical protein [Caballeronia hypogeia]